MDEITNPLYTETRVNGNLANTEQDVMGFYTIKEDALNSEHYVHWLDNVGQAWWDRCADRYAEMLQEYGVKWDPAIRF